MLDTKPKVLILQILILYMRILFSGGLEKGLLINRVSHYHHCTMHKCKLWHTFSVYCTLSSPLSFLLLFIVDNYTYFL